MIKPCLKLITFDATNTLLKYKYSHFHQYKKVANDFGYKTDETEIEKYFQDSLKRMDKTYPNYGKGSIEWEEWWRKVVKGTFENILPQDAPYYDIANTLINDFRTTKCWCVADGAQKLLYQLKCQGLEIGIISNTDPRLYDVLKCLGLYCHLMFIILSYDVGISKPDKRIFDLARTMDGRVIKPSECLHIGDDVEKDYQGAREAGWHAYLVTDKPLEKPPAIEHVFDSLDNMCHAF